MFAALLQETFRLFGGLDSKSDGGAGETRREATLDQAVEHVVDETFGRLRILPGYVQRLRGPVRQALSYIDELVEEIPEAISCNRSAFVSDPRVNAFFAGPDQIQEVFSHSEEVRELFESVPEAQECWALMCMRREERRQFGMELVGDEVRKEVMQTGVSFTAHQLVSPGATEADARQALKCCIFNSLLAYIRRRSTTAKEQVTELENRRRVLQGRLRHRSEGTDPEVIRRRIEEVERSLAGEELRLVTLEDHLAFVIEVLEDPSRFVNRSAEALHISRLGVKLEGEAAMGTVPIPVVEIRVACHRPRVAALARFPRAELLPQQDYLQKADLFLVV